MGVKLNFFTLTFLTYAVLDLVVNCDARPHHDDLLNNQGLIIIRDHHQHKVRRIIFGILAVLAIVAGSFYLYRYFTDRTRPGTTFSERGMLLPPSSAPDAVPTRIPFPSLPFWPFTRTQQPGMTFSAPGMVPPVLTVHYSQGDQEKALSNHPWERL